MKQQSKTTYVCRRNFIPELRRHISESIPLCNPTVALEAVNAWCEGAQPRTPIEHAVFGVCEQVARDVYGEDA